MIQSSHNQYYAAKVYAEKSKNVICGFIIGLITNRKNITGYCFSDTTNGAMVDDVCLEWHYLLKGNIKNMETSLIFKWNRSY